ncbi:HD domain-containing protein [Paraliobacillus salinarum]|uniref:HD domain-containing protein n=1 Tax=Paraliobacillus salinarum TaxID=1158996 RepID=UPI001FEADAB2|nr:HD domain-containing protein [Paraliobacillus salinarum]
MKKDVIQQTKAFVYQRFQHDSTGHDYAHMERVAKMSHYIAKKEDADPFLAEIAGWLHDVADSKLTDDPKQAEVELRSFLESLYLTEEQITVIMSAIETVSFRKGKQPNSVIGQVVQDADRLDAIGAIGIARAFSFGGNRENTIYSESSEQKNQSTIQHFYDKLLRLKDQLHTNTAKQIAKERHLYMEGFLNQFFQEWDFLKKDE